jgi:ankyrin repeat protein
LQIVNLQDVHGRTPLFIAAERREIAIVNLLLNKVKYALKGNKELFFKFLNTSENHMNWTPLMVATYDSASRIIELILKAAQEVLGKNSEYYQAFINARGSFGRSSTTLTVDPSDRWLLLEYGARDDVDLDDPQTKELKAIGGELLKLASDDGHEAQMKKLFENFSTNFKDNYQAFLYILTGRDEGGWTALMNAASDGNVNYITQIVTAAADFFKKDVVTALLKKGIVRDDTVWVSILLNNADVHGRTALHLAIERRHASAVKELLAMHKKVFGDDRRTFNRFMNNRTELNGFTPLLLAAYVSSDDQQSFDTIKMIVDRALEVFHKDSVDYERFMNATDLDGQTALSYVVSPRIRAFLKGHGAR